MKLHHLATLLIACLCFLCSCSDEESFTRSTGVQLEFEHDTISFDTLFNEIPSSTRRFKIFNRASEGVRIISARIASGGRSGFRVNIDGHSGALLSDIEIGGKDSIFVFAEATLPSMDTDTLTLVRDSLMLYLESGVLQQIILEAHGQEVRMMHSPVINNDRILTSERPYVIYDSLVVAPEATITLSAGTTLCFHNSAILRVHGRLIAEGTLEQPVILRGDRTDRMFSYLQYENMVNQWGGVIISPESFGNELNYLDLHGSQFGIICEKANCKQLKLTMRNSVVHNVNSDALKLIDCMSEVSNCQISNAGNHCLNIVGGKNTFVQTTVAQFFPWTAVSGTAMSISNSLEEQVEQNSEETQPTVIPVENLLLENCIVTGQTNDEILVQRIEEEQSDFNVTFRNCLVNIRLGEDDPDWAKAMFVECLNESDIIKQYEEAYEHKENTDKFIFGAKNFKNIAYDMFLFDLEPDSVSNAIGLGKLPTTISLPLDRLGRERGEHPDAGCYQYKK